MKDVVPVSGCQSQEYDCHDEGCRNDAFPLASPSCRRELIEACQRKGEDYERDAELGHRPHFKKYIRHIEVVGNRIDDCVSENDKTKERIIANDMSIVKMSDLILTLI